MNKRQQLTSPPLGKSGNISVSADSSVVNNDNALSVVINQRLVRQQQKYRLRSGVFPVRFTGSLHDFTIILMESHANDSARDNNKPLVHGEVANEGRFPSMMRFTPCGVNIWIKRFHDYWLRLLDLVAQYQNTVLPAQIDPKVLIAGNAAKYASPFNQHDRETMIDILLEIFEKDVYLLPSQQQDQQASLDYVHRHINEANGLLAKSISDWHYLL